MSYYFLNQVPNLSLVSRALMTLYRKNNSGDSVGCPLLMDKVLFVTKILIHVDLLYCDLNVAD